MPSYAIEKLGDRSVDLFINKNSLGEIPQRAAAHYVSHITRSTRYFFHMNHDATPDTFVDGSSGLLGRQYPVPKDQFKLLFRYLDMGPWMHDGRFDLYSNDIFLYLYERR